MFTGIVEEVGEVVRKSDTGLAVRAAFADGDGPAVSDSVSVNGACLTVTEVVGGAFWFDTVPETLRRTNLGALYAGAPVNLERPMRADGRFGGHVVQGHVDATGAVLSITPEGESRLFKFEAPPSVMRYVVEKGFIAVDGTSLTVVSCSHRAFSVAIVPYTWENTVLGSRKVGDAVNLEADIMAKYVERLASGPRLPIDAADEL